VANLTVGQRLLILLVLWYVLQGGFSIGGGKPTAATYFYEKDDTAIPAAVEAAIDQINRMGIKASIEDDDVLDGSGEVPAQYKLTLPAAQAAGIPAFVTSTKDKVLKVIKNPKTDVELLEAVK
jgi:hypothetical protein